MIPKFTIDKRYNHINIGFDFSAKEWDEICNWCDGRPEYQLYTVGIGIVCETEQDLTAFLLRWL